MTALTGGRYGRACGLGHWSSFHSGSLRSSRSRRGRGRLLARLRRLRLRRLGQRIILVLSRLPLSGAAGLARLGRAG
jgi:hypothetical protein